MISEIVEAVRRPEYTGENRCPPCTVVNLLLAVLLGTAVSRRSKPAGAVVGFVSVGLIYLRGYLIPGTPELTKRYLPTAVLRWFGKEPEPDLATGLGTSPPPMEESGASAGGDGDEAVTAPEDLEAYFLDAGILELREDGSDLRLTEGFEGEWVEAIESTIETGIDTETAVGAFGFDDDPGEFELEETAGGAYALRFGSREGDGPRYTAAMWPSYAALVADVAASRRLGSWLEEWDGYDTETKGQLLGGLRMFLETCPTADGGVEMTEETVTSCCSSETVVAVVCEETGDRLFEQPIPES